MFAKVMTPDNTTVAVNVTHVRAIYEVHTKRCNIAFSDSDKTLAVNMGIDEAIAALTPQPASTRARKMTQ
ncbi:MAG TPA: hypothetical protein VIC30_13595 [Orrella sp.]